MTVDLPAALQRYFSLLDVGDGAGAAAQFSKNCLYAAPSQARADGAARETEPRVLIEGRAALRERFALRGVMPHRHTFLSAFGSAAHVVIYGVARNSATNEPWATFLSSAHLDGEGAIARYLGFYCIPAVESEPPTRDGIGTVDPHRGRGALQRLMQGEVVGGEVTEAAVVSLPPSDGARVRVRSRDRITRELAAAHRQIVHCYERGNDLLLEGTREFAGAPGVFLASASVDGGGALTRYVEFGCEETSL